MATAGSLTQTEPGAAHRIERRTVFVTAIASIAAAAAGFGGGLLSADSGSTHRAAAQVAAAPAHAARAHAAVARVPRAGGVHAVTGGCVTYVGCLPAVVAARAAARRPATVRLLTAAGATAAYRRVAIGMRTRQLLPILGPANAAPTLLLSPLGPTNCYSFGRPVVLVACFGEATGRWQARVVLVTRIGPDGRVALRKAAWRSA